MTYDNIVDLALTMSHTKSAQVTAANLKTFFNIKRKELANVIVKDVDEEFFFQIWKRDAIASQTNGEYPYPEADDDSAGMLKLKALYVKGYSTDLQYTKAREVKLADLPYDWDYYLEYQPKSDPIYFIGDSSIFIAPQFAAADLPDSPSGNVQVKLIGIPKFIDLDTGATSAAILIPDDSHHRIAIGMKELILRSRNKVSEADKAFNEFEAEKGKMIDELTNRDTSQMIANVPDDTNLQYGE